MKKLIPYIVFWCILAGIIVALRPSAATIIAGARPHPAKTEPCAGGGPPNYCANSTRDLVPVTPMAPPAANTPFRDPDFGSRMMRVTDANTLAQYGSDNVGLSFLTDSSQEANTWGKFDPQLGPHGGYRFVIDANNGGTIPFTMDATTMRVERFAGKPGSYLNKTGLLDLHGPSFSYTDSDILYGTQGTELFAYSFSKDKKTPLYNFASCPGLPSFVSKPWMYAGDPNVTANDKMFSYYFGGEAQGATTFLTFYDRSANNGAGACYWYDTQTGMVGGTNMAPTPIANQVGQLPPPPAPKVTPQPGTGSLPPGDYFVRITGVVRMNPEGETTPSPEVGPVHLASPGSLVVSFPAQLPNPSQVAIEGPNCSPYHNSLDGCTPFNVYIGTARGKEFLQNTKGSVGGSKYVQSTALNAGSRQPPETRTAGFNVHGAHISRDGSYISVYPQETQTIFFWRPGTTQVNTCLFIADACGGHMAIGYSHLVNAPNDYDMAEVIIRPLSNPAKYTELVRPLPKPPQFTGSHWTWNDDNPSDTMPACGSFYAGGSAQGDGTQNLLTNPFMRVTRAYDLEIVCVATTGPSRVWRFAHARSAEAANDSPSSPSWFWGTPRGNVSQDGKFYMFTSNWDWSLGNQRGSTGCPSSGQCRADVFIVELK